MPQMFGNLSIRPRMVGLLAVPVAAAVLLGGTVAAAGWGQRARAADDRRLAALAGQAVAAAHELQEERARAVAWTAEAGRGGEDGLAARRGRVDRALAAYRAGAAALGPSADPALDQALAVAAGRLDRLTLVRAEVDRRLATADQVTADHDRLVAGLLGVTLELAHRLDAPVPAGMARLLLAVAAAKEATGRERSLLAATPARPAGATGAGATPAAVRAVPRAPAGDRDEVLAARLTAAAAVARHELIGVRAAAGDHLGRVDRALAAPGARRARRLELALLRPAAGPPAAGDPEAWRAGLAARAGALRQLERAVAGDLDQAAGAWLGRQQRRARDQLAVAALATLATLAAALLLLAGLGGRRPGPEAAAAATVPGLARRGQALAERQLRLLDELVRDEADPHRHRDLLGVDHLATRLRAAPPRPCWP
jgi:Nitrate and nitrite sensing